MSAHHPHDHHGEAHHGDHGHHGEEDFHFTKKDYHVGFVLAVILTVIPFVLTMGGFFEDRTTAALWILGLGAAQMVVHVVYFLHMNSKSQGGWIMLAFIFTLILLSIAVVGSLWVMFHMNENLMPMSEHMLRIRP
ncbi:MAG: cytochrome o ubiquinol oxidase subunit IV [Lautropia sp.]|nr:cytochrome o ubiquinol oxidase subunit IV [Lautropia sp.]